MTPYRRCRKLTPPIVAGCAIVLLPLVWPPAAHGETIRDSYETAEPSWCEAGADVKYRIDLRHRTMQDPHGGKMCEHLAISAAAGSYVHFAQEVGPALVVDELLPRIWIKADRPGVQFMTRVVLPRTVDPNTGRPLTTLVRGTMIAQGGAWQQLQIDEISKQLARQIRALRAQIGPQVDAHEAYIDQVLLNVYGGVGTTNVWIDDLEIAGFVPRGKPTVVQVAATMPVAGENQPAAPPHDVRLNGSLLQVDNHPFFTRAVQYQGEPLDYLQGLGFNAVQLSAAPDLRFLEVAARLNMWVICPPPDLQEYPSGDGGTAVRELPDGYDAVLAWDLGSGLSGRELEATAVLAKKLRMADARRSRPVIGAPDAELRAYSRSLDILIASRNPLGTSLELTDYGAWLRERPRLARPGTPFWTIVQTQLSPRLYEQLTILTNGAPPEAMPDQEAVRLLTRTVVGAGVRGIIFESQSRLDINEPATKSRAVLAELMNLELDLIEPWAAAGSLVTNAGTSDPALTAAVIQTDRAKLLLPLRTTAGCQQVPRQSSGSVSFVAPGVAESADVYELTYTGFRPLRHRRVAGGVSVTIDDFALGTMIVVTSDPMVIGTLTKRTARVAQRAIELERELAARNLLEVEEIERRMPASSHAVPIAGSATHAASFAPPNYLTNAKSHLAEADRALLTGDRAAASAATQKVLADIGSLKRDYWTRAITPTGSTVSDPFAVSFATLPQHFLFSDGLKLTRTGENLLRGGDFENLTAMVDAGWRHYQHPQNGVKTNVELSPKNPLSGQFSLHLRARAADDAAANSLVETPPIWVTSAPIPLAAGTLVCIRGHARVSKPITGNVDGLMILDSWTGEALAERIGQTTGWKEFLLYRVAPADGPLTLTFALSGLGDAWLDDVSVRPVQRPAPQRLDQPRQPTTMLPTPNVPR